MRTIQLFISLLLFSFIAVGQNIIPQKSDTTRKKNIIQYYGDEEKVKTETPKSSVKEEVVAEPVSAPMESSLQESKQNTEPTVIKYYQTVEPKNERDLVKHKRNRGQIKTLSGSSSHSGGFGAMAFKTSSFQDKTLVLAGISGGWVVNRTLAIGVDMYGVIPTTEYPDIRGVSGNELRLLGGYGGFLMELILFSNEVVHLTFPMSAGAGWLGYEDDLYDGTWSGDNDDVTDDDVFWYVEPGANLELNIARNFRMSFGVSQRFTQDLDLINTKSEEFEQLNYYVKLKVGRF